MTKLIFITGGVISSLGKGLTTATLGLLLKERGYKIKIRKLDPYLNIDPGTMNPREHGEVFVTQDGAETDLDLGHYERFTNIVTHKEDSISAGQIYYQLLKKERKGEYLGGTIQTIPHVTDIIKNAILHNTENIDFLLCEIGGTVGDIEAGPFLEAIRQLSRENQKCMFIHMTFVPYISAIKSLKTKPTQHSIKALTSVGIQPDMILCRVEKDMSSLELDKIALFSNLDKSNVLPIMNLDTIYRAPAYYHDIKADISILQHFNMPLDSEISLHIWNNATTVISNFQYTTKIAIVCKYFNAYDAYKSLIEAINHAGVELNTYIDIKWIDSNTLTSDNVAEQLQDVYGIIVPGGFGSTGIDGKIHAIKYARENQIPFLGICLGLQLAIIEFARNVCKLNNVNSTEFDQECDNPVVALMTSWNNNGTLEKRSNQSDLGGTMRLGHYNCVIKQDTLASRIYQSQSIQERHRHRYEFNNEYYDLLEKNGLVFSGQNDHGLVEIIEDSNHKFFIAVQFHPEFQSSLYKPHPVFVSLIKHTLDFNNSEPKLMIY